jgi:hypothetical protein
MKDISCYFQVSWFEFCLIFFFYLLYCCLWMFMKFVRLKSLYKQAFSCNR